MPRPERILVTGAAGKTGRAVLRALIGRGSTVRALVRRPEQESIARAAGAAEVSVGDLLDERELARAAGSIDAVYCIVPNMHRDEAAIVEAMIEVARQAGVRRFVYHSVLHPHARSMPHHARKLDAEERLFESGLEASVLQPAAYMQNLLPLRPQILERGLLPVPYPVSTRIGLVDLADVGEAAARVLTEEGHGDATYPLCGPHNPTQEEVAATLSRVLGRPVRAVERSLEDWRAEALEAGLDREVVEDLLTMFDAYRRFGLSGNPNVLRWLLGRDPGSLADFAARDLAPAAGSRS